MAITEPVTAVTGADTTSSSTRTSTMPTVSTDDVVYALLMGNTASTGKHGLTSTGVTWTLVQYVTASQMCASIWKGVVTNGGTASGATITTTSYLADGTTTAVTKVARIFAVARGTGVSNATESCTVAGPIVNASGQLTIDAPTAPATSIDGCVAWTVAFGSRNSNVPNVVAADLDLDGAAFDYFAATGGTTALWFAALTTDLTALPPGATPGGDTIDVTPGCNPLAAVTLVIRPALTAPTISASPGNADPVVGDTVALNAALGGGAATTITWSFVSGPTNPTITGGSTANATVTPSTPGTYVYHVDASNTAGSAPQQTVTFYLHGAPGTTVAVVGGSLGSFSLDGGGSLTANMNDALTTTGAKITGTLSHSNKLTLDYAPAPSGHLKLNLNSKVDDDTGGPVMRVQVFKADGVTMIYDTATGSGTGNVTLTETFTTHVVELDSTAEALVPALSDRRGLIAKVSAA